MIETQLKIKGVAGTQISAIRPADPAAQLPLSFAQQRLWFLTQMGIGGRAFHIGLDFRIYGSLQSGVLRMCLDKMVARHAVLRTSFVTLDGGTVQRVASPEGARFQLVEYDLRGRGDAQTELRSLITAEASDSFDLETGPLVRGRLVRQEDDLYLLLITFHHAVADGLSNEIFTRELTQLYNALLRGAPDPLPPLAVQYADFAFWQRERMANGGLRHQADYWRAALADAALLLNLPTDHPRSAQRGDAAGLASIVIDEGLTKKLRTICKKERCTLYIAILTCWATLLARFSGQEDIIVGTPVANRPSVELEGLVGMFVNTVAIRVGVEGPLRLRDLIARVKLRVVDALRNQDIPFEQVVEIVRPERSLSHSPLFQVMFAWQTGSGGKLELCDAEVVPHYDLRQRVAPFDLTLYLRDAGETIVGGLEYAEQLFDRSTVDRYVHSFFGILGQLVADVGQSVNSLSLLSGADRDRILNGWNSTEAVFPGNPSAHQMFEDRAAKTPDAAALIFQNSLLTYDELNRRANRLAHFLRRLGVSPEARAVICVERGVEMVVGMLAVLKAGGAYIPLDPAYPIERLCYMLEDSLPAVLLTQQCLHDTFSACSLALPIIDLDDPVPPWLDTDDTNPDAATIGLTPHNLAYVIYTSGSTGAPKGVAIEHRSLTNLLCSMQARPGLRAGDVLLAVTTVGFDIAGLELFLPLTVGATVKVLGGDTLFDGARLAEELDHVTVMQATPATWRLLLECGWLGNKELKALCGGEALSSELAHQLIIRCKSVWNMYGPTETTIWSLIEKVEADSRISIGRPIANTRIYILDSNREPVPVGVVGELYIAGAGVARGYLNRPELTAEKFVADPFVDDPLARMYSTGDLGRWLADGNVEFLGRNDFQVKIRGFRIELGEIEARLGECADVREAVVVARGASAEDKRLIAYYTTTNSENSGPEAHLLRSHLAANLPAYMLPAAYVRLESLPRTANGKLDRNALPAPTADTFAVQGYEAPRGETENALARIWADVLKVERVGRHDNFFSLGGHSLLVMQVASRARSLYDIDLPLRLLLEFQTIAELSERVPHSSREKDSTYGLPSIASCRDESLPLSFNQQARLLGNRLASLRGEAPYPFHVRAGFLIEGVVDESVAERAINAVIQRHQVLRTGFPEAKLHLGFKLIFPVIDILISANWSQRFLRRIFKSRAIEESSMVSQAVFPSAHLNMLFKDLRDLPEADKEAQLERIALDEGYQVFDCSRPPLMRACLVRLQDRRFMLIVTIHHLVFDGWSINVFKRDFLAYYRALFSGGTEDLPGLPIHFVDFSRWQRSVLRGEALKKMLTHWKEKLVPYNPVTSRDFFFSSNARGDPTYKAAVYSGEAGDELSEGLQKLAASKNVTMSTLLFALVATALHCETQKQRLGLMMVFANRRQPETEDLIGNFVNSHMVHTNFPEGARFLDILEQAKDAILDAYSYQEIPMSVVFASLGEEIGFEIPRNTHVSDIIQYHFVEYYPPVQSHLLTIEDAALPPEQYTENSLRIVCVRGPDRLSFQWIYSADVFRGEDIKGVCERLILLARKIVHDVEYPISSAMADYARWSSAVS